MGNVVSRDYVKEKEKIKKIAYITEKRPGEKIDGGNIQDPKMLNLLYQLGDVKLYYSDVRVYHRYEYIRNNSHKPPIIDEINNTDFDVVIITARQTSPFLMGYRQIKHKKYFWLLDSAFLMRKNTNFLNIKYKIVNTILAAKERNLIKREQCAYLGKDEINSLPKKYRKNAVVFPYYIGIKPENYFDTNGHVLYIGQFSYWTNKEAFYKILRIAPRIAGKIKIFGLNIPKISRVPKNVELAGYAESLDDVYMGAKALIYPISCGTGIKNKVIEAMSYGIPVIGFKNAFTNMEVEHNRNVIIVHKTSGIINSLKRTDLGVISEGAYLFIKRKMSEAHALSCIRKCI